MNDLAKARPDTSSENCAPTLDIRRTQSVVTDDGASSVDNLSPNAETALNELAMQFYSTPRIAAVGGGALVMDSQGTEPFSAMGHDDKSESSTSIEEGPEVQVSPGPVNADDDSSEALEDGEEAVAVVKGAEGALPEDGSMQERAEQPAEESAERPEEEPRGEVAGDSTEKPREEAAGQPVGSSSEELAEEPADVATDTQKETPTVGPTEALESMSPERTPVAVLEQMGDEAPEKEREAATVAPITTEVAVEQEDRKDDEKAAITEEDPRARSPTSASISSPHGLEAEVAEGEETEGEGSAGEEADKSQADSEDRKAALTLAVVGEGMAVDIGPPTIATGATTSADDGLDGGGSDKCDVAEQEKEKEKEMEEGTDQKEGVMEKAEGEERAQEECEDKGEEGLLENSEQGNDEMDRGLPSTETVPLGRTTNVGDEEGEAGDGKARSMDETLPASHVEAGADLADQSLADSPKTADDVSVEQQITGLESLKHQEKEDEITTPHSSVGLAVEAKASLPLSSTLCSSDLEVRTTPDSDRIIDKVATVETFKNLETVDNIDENVNVDQNVKVEAVIDDGEKVEGTLDHDPPVNVTLVDVPTLIVPPVEAEASPLEMDSEGTAGATPTMITSTTTSSTGSSKRQNCAGNAEDCLDPAYILSSPRVQHQGLSVDKGGLRERAIWPTMAPGERVYDLRQLIHSNLFGLPETLAKSGLTGDEEETGTRAECHWLSTLPGGLILTTKCAARAERERASVEHADSFTEKERPPVYPPKRRFSAPAPCSEDHIQSLWISAWFENVSAESEANSLVGSPSEQASSGLSLASAGLRPYPRESEGVLLVPRVPIEPAEEDSAYKPSENEQVVGRSDLRRSDTAEGKEHRSLSFRLSTANGSLGQTFGLGLGLEPGPSTPFKAEEIVLKKGEMQPGIDPIEYHDRIERQFAAHLAAVRERMRHLRAQRRADEKDDNLVKLLPLRHVMREADSPAARSPLTTSLKNERRGEGESGRNGGIGGEGESGESGEIGKNGESGENGAVVDKAAVTSKDAEVKRMSEQGQFASSPLASISISDTKADKNDGSEKAEIDKAEIDKAETEGENDGSLEKTESHAYVKKQTRITASFVGASDAFVTDAVAAKKPHPTPKPRPKFTAPMGTETKPEVTDFRSVLRKTGRLEALNKPATAPETQAPCKPHVVNQVAMRPSDAVGHIRLDPCLKLLKL